MKLNAKFFLSLFILLIPTFASAITDKEMEEARAIAAKAYLRYANDLSGYLDDIHPKTMAELEKSLKPKEKENLKAFKAIAAPTDYSSWDRAKLEEYWGTTVFKSKGLIEKGRAGKIGAKRDLKKMTVGAPESASALPTATQSAGKPEEKPATDAGQKTDETSAALDSISMAEATLESQLNDLENFEEDPEIDKASNHTWVYILILCVLVGVVVALVVFASNVMKRNGMNPIGPTQKRDSGNIGMVSSEASAMRNDYADKLYAKSQEIAELNKKLQNQIKTNESLQRNLESALAENARLHSRIEQLQNHATPEPSPVQMREKPNSDHQAYMPKMDQPSPSRESHTAVSSGSSRTIYLGRVNSRGLFVRADRSINPGNTIYQLETSDGMTGTFRVVQDLSVLSQALSAPIETLGGGSTIADPNDIAGKSRIVTDYGGTAIFENGCWKVLRKSKVHFE